MKEETYYVAATIGGWLQNAVFSGTLEECQKYMENNPSLGYGTDTTSIIHQDDYEVDYL